MFSTTVCVNVSSLSPDQLSSLEEEGARRIQCPATANSKSHGAKSHIYDDHSDSHLFHMLGATICFFLAASIRKAASDESTDMADSFYHFVEDIQRCSKSFCLRGI